MKYFDKEIKLRPIELGKYCEQVMIINDDYVIGVVHVDTFYDKNNLILWNLLSGKNYDGGMDVTCHMTLAFEVPKEDE